MDAILVIDDDDSILNLITHKLLNSFKVIAVKRGNAAVDVLRNDNISLVLMDQVMPEIDGLDTFNLLKGAVPVPPPVIMMTAYTSTELIVSFMKSGGADFISKPLDFDILGIKIRRGIEASRERKRDAGQSAEADRFFQMAPDPFCIVGLDGKFHRINEAFQEMSGYGPPELADSMFHSILHKDDAKRALSEIARINREGGRAQFAARLVGKDREPVSLAWNAAVDSTGGLLYITARGPGV